jgi:SAM-dependent methyltransferase
MTQTNELAKGQVDLFNSTYSNFQAAALRAVREATYGEDIGQSSWLTADEYRRFFRQLELDAGKAALDVASGSGGPASFMAHTTGCHVTGVDINEHAINTANETARAAGLTSRLKFVHTNASKPLPFEDASFDAIVCIDSIHHFLDRREVLRDWYRILKPGGRALYTDPIIVSGIVTNEEIALRSSIGYFQFTPPGVDERLIREAGFELLGQEDVTENAAIVAKRWHDGRARHREALLEIEGEERFVGLQRFLDMVHRVSVEHSLSRHAFLFRRPA